MVGRKYSYITMLLILLGVEADAIELKIQNQLANCAEFRDTKIVLDDTFPLLSFDLKLKNSIADCGCKSALGMFSVVAQRESYASYLISGKVALGEGGEKAIPVAADISLISGASLDVIFSCAQPD